MMTLQEAPMTSKDDSPAALSDLTAKGAQTVDRELFGRIARPTAAASSTVPGLAP